MKKILMIGDRGILGGWVKQEFSQAVLCPPDMDMSHEETANSYFNRTKPDVIINLAGYTGVDACESDIQRAYKSNVGININIAEFLKKNKNCFCVAISTDHLYDAIEGTELKTESQWFLTNVYSLTKKMGEDVLPVDQSIILRTNFFGRSLAKKSSFTDWLFENFNKNVKINLYCDCYFSPLHGKTLAGIIARIIQNPKFGIFNLGSQNGMSKADFALALAKVLELDPLYSLVRLKDLTSQVRRPLDMRMNASLFEKTYGLILPELQAEIQKCKAEYSV